MSSGGRDGPPINFISRSSPATYNQFLYRPNLTTPAHSTMARCPLITGLRVLQLRNLLPTPLGSAASIIAVPISGLLPVPQSIINRTRLSVDRLRQVRITRPVTIEPLPQPLRLATTLASPSLSDGGHDERPPDGDDGNG